MLIQKFRPFIVACGPLHLSTAFYVFRLSGYSSVIGLLPDRDKLTTQSQVRPRWQSSQPFLVPWRRTLSNIPEPSILCPFETTDPKYLRVTLYSYLLYAG